MVQFRGSELKTDVLTAYKNVWEYCFFANFDPLRARRALKMFKDVPLRTRRALLLYRVYGDSALVVLNLTSLNSVNALLALS